MAGYLALCGPGGAAELTADDLAGGVARVGELTAVGDVTLHNRAAVAASLDGGGQPVPPGCSDLELLLRCYARRGPAGLRVAEGMFTLAVAGPAGLVLVRDHVGARTAFWRRAGDSWAASASLRALRRLPGLPVRLHLPAVAAFLTFAYVPGPQTLLEGVHELLPGRCVFLGRDGSVRTEVFWEPEEAVSDPELSPEAYVKGLRSRLETATAARLPAGAAVGSLLSGGIDSSVVTALAARLHDQPVHTYAISFGDDLPNELAYSSLVATHCGTRHRVLTVSGEAVAARLADAVALLDAPVGDPLTVPNLMLAEAVAADGLGVVLNGEGGDPVFGGPKNLPMLLWQAYRPDDPAGRAAAYLRSYRKCFPDLPRLLTADALAALGPVSPALEELVSPYLSPGGMPSYLNQLLHANLRTKGAHHILPKVEKITSSCGLSGRAPLFDVSVVEHAFATPPRLKLAGTVEKWVLKRAAADLLPDTIVHRPKSGMRVPVQRWLRGPLADLARDVLLGRRTAERGVLRQDLIRDWLRGRGSLYPRHGAKVWQVLTLELWLRSFLD
jgi:asparagine synthase (glutamine-hydrolysing)